MSAISGWACEVVGPDNAREVVGALSGRSFNIPDDSFGFPTSMPLLFEAAGEPPKPLFDVPLVPLGQPDQRSAKLKLCLLLPATNTSMEPELYDILCAGGRRAGGPLDGVGIHSVGVLTAKPAVATKEDVEEYGRQFLAGLQVSLTSALLAKPQYLIMGMSLEHVMDDIDAIRSSMEPLQQIAGLGLTTWHDAAAAALGKFNARRIALLSPFNPTGDANARAVFAALGFEVVRSVGFNCSTAVDICHVPDDLKERAILESLSAPCDIEAVVQCGTNMSLTPVIERVEARAGVPIIGINQCLLWHALRECGINVQIDGCGRLFREF